MTCGGQVLVACLRPSNIDGARHAWAILALLAGRLREEWPGVEITFRGDCGFCRHRMLDWRDAHGVGCIVGPPRNNVLATRTRAPSDEAEALQKATGADQRRHGELTYAAGTWTRGRRVIHKAERNALGPNDRYVVTSLAGNARHLYEDVYCARGDMGNRIKEQQLGLFAGRTGPHSFATNPLRLLPGAFAYTLTERMRKLALRGTAFAKAQCGTMRLKLLGVAAVIRRNTRTLHVSLSPSYPHADAFRLVARRIAMVT